jgi:hypothetical protein
MLTRFPEFKTITIDSREHIDSIVSKFPPYSDFNFVSMHSWNIKDSMQISELDGNLVVLFKDYTSDKSFLSFIGDQNVDQTIETLLGYAPSHGFGSELHLIPEHVITLIKDADKFIVTEDRDNHDYIILALKLGELEGQDYASKRKGVNKFKAEYANRMHTKKLEINEQSAREIVNSFHNWRQESGKSHIETADELGALHRLLKDAHHFPLTALGVYVDDVMVAYAIYELQDDYAIGHFMKASKAHTGLYDFLKNSTAIDIHQQGAKYINYEQDLGIEGLRKSKLLLRPEAFLKKFTVALSGRE